MKYADEIREQYYDLEDFVRELQSISNQFEGKVFNCYIDRLNEIWCDADNERERLEETVREIEQGDAKQEMKDFNGDRV